MIGKYESMIILAPTLSNEEVEKETKKITDLIAELGGELTQTDTWGKKQLAYMIQKFKEGIFYIFYFTLDTQKTKQIDRHYRLTESIIRHNILKLDAYEEDAV